jgi:hypothetical protein
VPSSGSSTSTNSTTSSSSQRGRSIDPRIDVEMARLGAGCHFGELEVLHRLAARESTVVASSPLLVVYEMPRVLFWRFLRGSTLAMMEALARRKNNLYRQRIAAMQRQHESTQTPDRKGAGVSVFAAQGKWVTRRLPRKPIISHRGLESARPQRPPTPLASTATRAAHAAHATATAYSAAAAAAVASTNRHAIASRVHVQQTVQQVIPPANWQSRFIGQPPATRHATPAPPSQHPSGTAHPPPFSLPRHKSISRPVTRPSSASRNTNNHTPAPSHIIHGNNSNGIHDGQSAIAGSTSVTWSASVNDGRSLATTPVPHLPLSSIQHHQHDAGHGHGEHKSLSPDDVEAHHMLNGTSSKGHVAFTIDDEHDYDHKEWSSSSLSSSTTPSRATTASGVSTHPLVAPPWSGSQSARSYRSSRPTSSNRRYPHTTTTPASPLPSRPTTAARAAAGSTWQPHPLLVNNVTTLSNHHQWEPQQRRQFHADPLTVPSTSPTHAAAVVSTTSLAAATAIATTNNMDVNDVYATPRLIVAAEPLPSEIAAAMDAQLPVVTTAQLSRHNFSYLSRASALPLGYPQLVCTRVVHMSYTFPFK